MQSNNPVFRNSDGFKPGYNIYGNPTYSGNGQPHAGYGQPQAQYDAAAGGFGQAGGPAAPYAPADSEVMTIDGVVQKTAASLGVLIVAAVATWILTPSLRDANVNLGPLVAAMVVGGGAAFALSMVNSFKRVISAPLVLLYAAAQGVALGGFSKVIDAVYSTPGSGNLIVQAVIGTFAALAGTLAAYKFLNIRLGARVQRFVVATMFGLVGLGLMQLVLGLFGRNLGLFGITGLGMVTAVVGLLLGIFMLLMDFQMVEQGVANRLPANEGWRAAFGLTVSLVWIYQNLLRILAYFNRS